MLGWFPHVPTTAGLNGEEERQEVADAETTWIRKELDMGHGGNGY
jgi:hypothetical protein